MRAPAPADPFAVLGLPASGGLTDDDVRAAWRRVATATHPDRADGGDPPRFAEAAAAYTTLRTPFGRNEALAGLAARGARRRPARSATPPAGTARETAAKSAWWAGPRRLWGRVRRGRPARLAGRVALTAAVSLLAVRAAGNSPATTAVVVGMVTWLGLTAHRDLAAR